MTGTTIEYLARCHCGALSARYRTAIPPSEWSVRACQCSFCRTHGSLSTSDPVGSLSFAVRPDERLQRYRFGGRTADFLICRECGVFIGARTGSAHGDLGVLNLVTLRPQPATLPPPTQIEFGNESPGERARRRAAVWTPLAPGSV